LGESFEPGTDWTFCAWLRNEKHLIAKEVKQQGNIEGLREKYNKLWTDIDKEFSGKNYRGKTYQQD
jgi:hypothetical protein